MGRDGSGVPRPALPDCDGGVTTPTRRRRADPDKVSKLPHASCGGCSARWQSMALAHCGACHESFGSVDLFDRHRLARGEHGVCEYPSYLPARKGAQLRMIKVDGVWREPGRQW